MVGSNSLCDVQTSDVNCSNVDIFGEKFLDGNLSGAFCQLENLSTKEVQNSTYVLVTENHVRCQVPEIWIDRINFYDQELKLRISIGYSEEKQMSEWANLIVYDSDCKVCEESRKVRKNIECRKKIGVCSVNGKCFKDGDKKPEDKCFVCKQGNWINEKRKFNDMSMKLIKSQKALKRTEIHDIYILILLHFN
jgi:hypothetical protein